MVINAVAGGGRAGSRWPALAQELDRRGLVYETAFTDAEGAAARLAEAGARDGCAAVVAVGGDGTVNEVVNGLMAASVAGAPPPVLGVIPSGTAQDFARSAGIPLDGRAAIDCLVGGQPRPLDVGRVHLASGAVRYFANYAGVGFDAMVAARAKAWGHPLRGALPYVVGFFAVLRGYRNKQFVVRPDGGPPFTPARRINMIILANGANYAGVMRMAPDASLDDGLLDVVVVGDVGPVELLASVPLVVLGRHLAHPKVTALRAVNVAITAAEPVLVQVDGEVAGELPATFDVIPGALRLLRA
jgi:diacylglycerol kinase (ATP)